MEAVLTGPAGRTLLGSSEVTIGCDADNSLIITDLRTSAHHAVVRPDGPGYAIIDLGSEDGTIVNGRWLDTHKLQPLLPGDVIQIGDTRLTFEVFQNPAAIPAGPLGVGVGSPAGTNEENGPLAATRQRSGIADQETGWFNRPLDPAKPSARPAFPKIHISSLLGRLQSGSTSTYTSQPWVPGGDTAYPSQQQLWRQDRRRLSLALVVILVILLISSLFALIVSRPSPDRTLDTFCSALITGNGQLVENQLSTSLQQVRGSLVIASLVLTKITTCAHTAALIRDSSATATLTVTFPMFHSNPGVANGQGKMLVTLIQDANGAWKIDGVQSNDPVTRHDLEVFL